MPCDLDPEGDVNARVHKACLELDITHIESLCNLEALIGQGTFRFIGLPLKWRGGTGSADPRRRRLSTTADFMGGASSTGAGERTSGCS